MYSLTAGFRIVTIALKKDRINTVFYGITGGEFTIYVTSEENED